MGSGSLDVSIFADDQRAGGKLGYYHHLRSNLSLFGEAWGTYDFEERVVGYGAAAGLRWRWN